MARVFPLLLALMATAAAQTAAPAGARQTAPAPAAPQSVSVLPNLQSTAVNTRVDLAALRVSKWKAKGDAKQEAESRINAIQRNLAEALPGLIDAARENPASLSASFKLYRNLNALYDVLNSLTESAGAFGPKEEFQALARDLDQLDAERRQLGDALETMTAQRDAEVVRMRQAVRQAESAPPKKIIIDDETAPPKKKPIKKKK